MPRRVRFIVFLGVVTMLVLATGLAAGAAPEGDIQSKEAEIAAAQERLAELRTDQSVAEAAYSDALYRMNQLSVKIQEADRDLDTAEDQLAAAQDDLEKRASEVYKSGNVGFINVLVGADDFSQFATRLDLWVRLLGEEKAKVEAVREARDDLEARKSALETERANRVEAVEEALANKERAAAAEAEAEAYLNSLNGELQAAIQAKQEQQAAAARAAAADAAAEAVSKEAPQPEAPQPEAPQPEVSAPAPIPQPDLGDQQAAIDAAAAAFAAQQHAEIAAERAAAAKRKAERKAAKQAEKEAAKEAAEQAAIEAAAAEQALAEKRAAERAAERRAQLKEEREALRAERAAVQAERQAERIQARRIEKRAAERLAARAAEREAAAASASASPTASASAAPRSRGAARASGSGADVIGVGQGYLGVPYALGACDPRRGMDCSCFTMLVYQEFGISLPDNPAAQYSYGTPVRGAPAAGDLLFWAEGGGGITHVGIAMGDGTTIHASVYAGEVVQGTPINAIPGYVGARRLL